MQEYCLCWRCSWCRPGGLFKSEKYLHCFILLLFGRRPIGDSIARSKHRACACARHPPEHASPNINLPCKPAPPAAPSRPLQRLPLHRSASRASLNLLGVKTPPGSTRRLIVQRRSYLPNLKHFTFVSYLLFLGEQAKRTGGMTSHFFLPLRSRDSGERRRGIFFSFLLGALNPVAFTSLLDALVL